MRRLFDRLTKTLRQFIAQRDDLLLLVPCDDSDFGLVLKALRDLDREIAGDLFLLFGERFSDARQFVPRWRRVSLKSGSW